MEIAKDSLETTDKSEKIKDKVTLQVLPVETHDTEEGNGNELKKNKDELDVENMKFCLGCGVVMGNIDIPITKLMEDNTDETWRSLQHDKRSYRCRICDISIDDRHEMTEHAIDHLKRNESPCEKCHNTSRRSSKDEQRQLLLSFLYASRSAENKLLAKYRRTQDLRVCPDITFPELVAIDEMETNTPYYQVTETYACRVCNSGIPTKETTSFHVLDHIEANDVFTKEHSRRIKKEEVPPKPKKPKPKRRIVTGYVKRMKSIQELAEESGATIVGPTTEGVSICAEAPSEAEIPSSVSAEKLEELELKEMIRIPKIPINMPYGVGYCEQCRKVHEKIDVIFEGTRERDVNKIVEAHRIHSSRQAIRIGEQLTSDQEIVTKKLKEFIVETLSHDDEFLDKIKTCFEDWEIESQFRRISMKQASESVANLFNISDNADRPSILFSELVAVENLGSPIPGTPILYRVTCRICHQEMPNIQNISNHILRHFEGNELFKDYFKEDNGND